MGDLAATRTNGLPRTSTRFRSGRASAGAELVAVAEMRLHGGRCDANRVAVVAEGHLVVAVLLSTGAVLVLRGARRLAFVLAVAGEGHACKGQDGNGDHSGQDDGGEVGS